ncbi:MAG TPA: DUF5590 domain-containing protein [Bacillales bacterium]|nr:DUF5590 domain-containing protein [Bacillales bacterium]
MKKWILTIAIFVFATVIWQAISIYHGIEAKLHSRLDHAAEKAKREYHLKKVLDVSYYHGTNSYDVVKAVNQKGQPIYVWIPNGKGKPFHKRVNQGWSKGKVMQYVQNKLHPRKVISVRLGAEESLPVWEVTYLDQNGRYSFYYLRFDNGEWVKNIHL